MAIRKALSVISGRNQLLPTVDRLTNVGSTYYSTTKRNNSEYDFYMNSGSTDANGRITFNLTTDGTASGPAIFSAIHHVNAIAFTSTTSIPSIPQYFVESISANLKQVTIRGISSQSGLVILGIGINQVAFVGSGLTGLVQVTGLPA